MLVSPKDKETLSPSVEDTKLSTNKQHSLSRQGDSLARTASSCPYYSERSVVL